MAPRSVRGTGVALVNMRELFAHDRLAAPPMELAPLPEKAASKWLLRAGDLLFARQSLTLSGAGKCVLVMPAAIDRTFESHIIRVRLDPNAASSMFYYYFFRSRAGRQTMETIVEAVAAAGIRASDLGKLVVPVPPLGEQRLIAKVLGALDDLIDTNERQIERLRGLVTELYQRALSKGAPRVLPFLDVFAVEFGGAFKGSYFTKTGVGMPLIRIRDLKTAKSDTWSTERLPNEVIVSPGDILFGMDAEFRASQWVGPESLLNQRVCRVTAPGASNAFALEALKAPLAYIESHKTGTTVIHLNKRDLEETRVLVPSDAAVSEFDAAAEPLRLWSVSLSAENDQLRCTRDELLPLLMSGAVRVRPEAVAS